MEITIPTNGNTEYFNSYNFEEKKEKIKLLFVPGVKGNLSVYGKVTITKSLIIPQLTKFRA